MKLFIFNALFMITLVNTVMSQMLYDDDELLLLRSSDDVDERRLVCRCLLLALDEIAACSSVIVLYNEGAPIYDDCALLTYIQKQR